jgi:DNA-directed RNA polymerase subunit E'
LYKLYTLEHVVEIPPEKFGLPKVQSAYEILSKEYQGIVDNDFGFVISIIEIIDVGPGKIIHNSAGTFHPVKFSLLAYKSEEAEIVEGEVVDALDMGIFIKLGYLDAMCHFSQLMDDSKPEFENVNQRWTSKKLGLSIQVKDVVREKLLDHKEKIGLELH